MPRISKADPDLPEPIQVLILIDESFEEQYDYDVHVFVSEILFTETTALTEHSGRYYVTTKL